MKIHHKGYACKDIEVALESIKKMHHIRDISLTIFDEYQQASLCMIDTISGDRIELVSGKSVRSILQGEGIKQYHTCYEVSNIFQGINSHKEEGSVLLSPPKPAKLFDNRLVAFLQTPSGMVELLEK